MTPADVTVEQLEQILSDAEDAYRKRGWLRRRRRFLAQYIYDSFHPAAGLDYLVRTHGEEAAAEKSA